MNEPFADTSVRHVRPFHVPDDHPPNFGGPVGNGSRVTFRREHSSTDHFDLAVRSRSIIDIQEHGNGRS
jgi:hypothetical protein